MKITLIKYKYKYKYFEKNFDVKFSIYLFTKKKYLYYFNIFNNIS